MKVYFKVILFYRGLINAKTIKAISGIAYHVTSL